MPTLFPGIFVARLFSIPGWIVGAFASSPKLLLRPLTTNLSMVLRGTPMFLILYGAITVAFGSLAWLALRSFGLLNLPFLLFAALLPVLAYVTLSAIQHGSNSGWHGSAIAFGVPAMAIGFGTWLFTVRLPL